MAVSVSRNDSLRNLCLYTYDQLGHLELMTEHADATQETECLVHEERVKHWYRQFDVTEMSGTLVRREVTGGASADT